jgi:hypothetical protein
MSPKAQLVARNQRWFALRTIDPRAPLAGPDVVIHHDSLFDRLVRVADERFSPHLKIEDTEYHVCRKK